LFRPYGAQWKKKLKVDFLENFSTDFHKILPEDVPHTALRNNITRDPPQELGAGPGGPKFWGDTPKISHFQFPGVEIFTTIGSAPWSLQTPGVEFPAGGWGFAPKPEQPPKLCRRFGHFLWSDLDQSTNFYTSDIQSPPISFWEKSDQRFSKKWGGRKLGGGTLLGFTPFGDLHPPADP